MTNYYEVLGVSRDASDETIRNRFRALARDAHPDRVTDPAKKAGPRLCKHGEEQGVILRAMVNDSMGFSPPLVITKDEVNEMLDRVGRALDALAVELRRESIAAV